MPSQADRSKSVTFLVCDDCETIFDASASSFEYAAGVGDDSAQSGDIDKHWPHFQYHYEMSAGVEILAKLVHWAQTLVPPRPTGEARRFMDIGGGTGITCEIAERLGWNAVNFEPCPAGYFAERMLNIKVVHDYLSIRFQTESGGMLPEHSFDAIIASEVIEHVPEPDEFASLIASYLTDDGVAILTTPNSVPAMNGCRPAADSSVQPSAGRSMDPMEMMETYCPGMHLNLFSPRSLEQLLRRNGFEDVRIITAEGETGQKRLFALACRRMGVLPADFTSLLDQKAIQDITVDHLKWVLDTRAESDKRDAWYYGACFRLFEFYVNNGRYELAGPYRDLIDQHLLDRGLTNDVMPLMQAANYHEFMRQMPAYLGKYCFFRGIYELNYKGAMETARAYFRSGHHICAIQEKVVTFTGYFALLSRFHEGIALLMLGESREALAIFDELDARATHIPPNLQKRVRWERAAAQLRAGEESLAVAQFAAMALEHFDFIKPGMREPIRNIFAACIARVDKAQSHLRIRSAQLESLAAQVAGELGQLKPAVKTRIERLEQLAERGAELAERVEGNLRTSLEEVRSMKRAVGRELHNAYDLLQTKTQRVAGLFEHGYELSNTLEARFNSAAAQVNKLADRSLVLAQKIEKGLERVNDTNRSLQRFVEHNQQPAGEILSRCGEIFSALEATAQTLHRTTRFVERGIASVVGVASLPVRMARGMWRALGLPSKRVSVRKIGLRDALNSECRIPLRELLPGIVIEQSARAAENGLCAVALSFGTCHRPNCCTLDVALLEETDGAGSPPKPTVVREMAVDISTLPDNRPYRIEFAPLNDSLGKTYRLRLSSSDSSPGNAITIWTRVTNSPRGLSYNGKPIVDAELMLELCYSTL
jgi:SAM-dependent methyltransferase